MMQEISNTLLKIIINIYKSNDNDNKNINQNLLFLFRNNSTIDTLSLKYKSIRKEIEIFIETRMPFGYPLTFLKSYLIPNNTIIKSITSSSPLSSSSKLELKSKSKSKSGELFSYQRFLNPQESWTHSPSSHSSTQNYVVFI